jgi:hypothetical protein
MELMSIGRELGEMYGWWGSGVGARSVWSAEIGVEWLVCRLGEKTLLGRNLLRLVSNFHN